MTNATSAFKILDIAPDTIMMAVVNAASRTHATGKATTVADIESALNLKRAQASSALTMAAQLHFVEERTAGQFSYVGNAQIRNTRREDLFQFFREAVQNYPPFLFFLSFLTRGFSEEQASRQSTSIFGIGLNPDRVASLFGRWARHAGIIDNAGQLDFRPMTTLDLDFMNRFHRALQQQVETRTFVLNELGAVAADLYLNNLDVDAISRSFISHQDNPKDSLRDVGSLVEAYLAQLSKPVGGPGALLGPLADFLSGASQTVILKTHKNLIYGVAGFRNAADHGSDPETGKPWQLTPEAALAGTLVSLLTIKSIARYVRDATQEV